MAKITKEAIEAERAERIKACAADIEALLEKHGVQLVAQPEIQDGRITAAVHIADRP